MNAVLPKPPPIVTGKGLESKRILEGPGNGLKTSSRFKTVCVGSEKFVELVAPASSLGEL
jgi:hypothetical protein